jgi:hypothetical protein
LVSDSWRDLDNADGSLDSMLIGRAGPARSTDPESMVLFVDKPQSLHAAMRQ